jgi:hypothetical protein
MSGSGRAGSLAWACTTPMNTTVLINPANKTRLSGLGFLAAVTKTAARSRSTDDSSADRIHTPFPHHNGHPRAKALFCAALGTLRLYCLADVIGRIARVHLRVSSVSPGDLCPDQASLPDDLPCRRPCARQRPRARRIIRQLSEVGTVRTSWPFRRHGGIMSGKPAWS